MTWRALYLAAASPYADEVIRTWQGGGLAEIPAGVLWDVVRLLPEDGRRVHDALKAEGRQPGPIMITGVTAWEFLVPRGTAATWDVPHTTALGPGKMLLAPHPDAQDLEGVLRRRWLTWPDPVNTLTNPRLLAAVARTAAWQSPAAGSTS